MVLAGEEEGEGRMRRTRGEEGGWQDVIGRGCMCSAYGDVGAVHTGVDCIIRWGKMG